MTNENATPGAAERAMKDGKALLDARDSKQAMKSFQCAADIYGQLGDHMQQSEGLNMVAGVLARTGRGDEALETLSGIIDLLAGEPKSSGRAMAWSNRGLILARQERLQDALGCFEEALVQFQQIDEPVRVAEQWANIGTTCRDLEQPDQAIKNYQQAIAIYQQLDHQEGMGDQLTNIAYALVMQGESMDGVRKYREALSYYACAGNNSKVQSTEYNIQHLEAALLCNRDGNNKPCNC
ncbi:MAG: tetratricopeptide repeat protein [Gammaproteobacteria bacterium]